MEYILTSLPDVATSIIESTNSISVLRNLYLMAENLPNMVWLRRKITDRYFDIQSAKTQLPVNKSAGCSNCDKENILPKANRGIKWPFTDDYICENCE